MVINDDPTTEVMGQSRGWQSAMVLFMATCGGLGRLPLFPGTWGSLLGLVITLLLGHQIKPLSHVIIVTFLFFLGVWVSGKAEMILGEKDHSSIVIDELVGFFVAVFLVPYGLWYLFAAFIIFRVFDTWKPWSFIESIRRGWGIMLDDLVAGIATNLVLQLYVFIF
jgi:phosphatidylglycerophosphatase A